MGGFRENLDMPTIECLIGELRAQVIANQIETNRRFDEGTQAFESIRKEVKDIKHTVDNIIIDDTVAIKVNNERKTVALWVGRGVLTLLTGGLLWVASQFTEWFAITLKH